MFFCFFFFNDTATTEIYTLSLHDALPISDDGAAAGRAPAHGDVHHRRLYRRNEGDPARHGLVESPGIFAHRSEPADVLPRGSLAQGGPHMDDARRRQPHRPGPHTDHGGRNLRARVLGPRRQDHLVRLADAARRGFLAGGLQRGNRRAHALSPATRRVVHSLQRDARRETVLRRWRRPWASGEGQERVVDLSFSSGGNQVPGRAEREGLLAARRVPRGEAGQYGEAHLPAGAECELHAGPEVGGVPLQHVRRYVRVCGRGSESAMKLTVLLLAAIPLAAAPRSIVPFDSGWRFLKAEAPGAEKPEFVDSAWRAVSLTHD